MNISGLDKNSVLTLLYNRAVPHAVGFLEYKREAWSWHDAVQWRNAHKTSFDPDCLWFTWIHGRSMWISLLHDDVNTTSYNAMNGPNAAEFAIADGIRTNDTNPHDVALAQANALEFSKRDTLEEFHDIGTMVTTRGTRLVGPKYSPETVQALTNAITNV